MNLDEGHVSVHCIILATFLWVWNFLKYGAGKKELAQEIFSDTLVSKTVLQPRGLTCPSSPF